MLGGEHRSGQHRAHVRVARMHGEVLARDDRRPERIRWPPGDARLPRASPACARSSGVARRSRAGSAARIAAEARPLRSARSGPASASASVPAQSAARNPGQVSAVATTSTQSTMTSATAPISSTVPPPPTASAAPETRARPASHWLNSQLASEAATVSSVTMRTAVAMTNARSEARRQRARPRGCRQFRYVLGTRTPPRKGSKKGFFNGARVLHNSRNDLA